MDWKKMNKALIAISFFLLIFSFAASQRPHVIIGKVIYNGTSVENASVTIINERTGEKLYATTDEKGIYSVVLMDLPSGWEYGDIIKAVAQKENLEGTATIVAKQSQGYQWLNITLSSGHPSPPPSPPSPPDELAIEIVEPANGSLVSGNVEIRGKVIWEGNGTISVEVKIDNGAWHPAALDNATEYGSTWHYKWNTTNVEDGQHKIYARAYDGEKYSQCYIIVEVDNEEVSEEKGRQLYLDVSLLIMAIVMGIMISKMNKK
jgi:hypothetical protein